jgi:hypothetical protein
MSNCNSPEEKKLATTYVAVTSGIDYTQSTPPPDIASKNQDANLTELAEFAWQEFIALNWPAVTNGRGAPDLSQTNGFITASAVGSTYLPVWQTYWHRNELFPAEGKTPVTPSITDTNPPIYQYSETYNYVSGTGGDYTLWNNLDEINELGQDVVFAHSMANSTGIDSTYQVLYEAKMNYDGANYIYANNLNNKDTREQLQANTVKDTFTANGVCGADPSKYICLPCGDLDTGTQGNIEIKAAWRKLTTDEAASNKYHTQTVIYYDNVKVNGQTTEVYKNDIMGLVGLHIIHKTETFPSFVYATWEHTDNLLVDSNNNRLVYTEIQNTNFGDNAKTFNNILRVHPIPDSIVDVNTTVNQYLATQNSVWQNYKLINVQAKPKDISQVTGSHTDTINSSYYLSNSVIESNIELQTFTGSTADSTFDNLIYKNQIINMGGCMGCHGNAQAKGTDFNFLIANAPFSFPEFTGIPEPGCPTGAAATPINTWADVMAFFNNCVVQTAIGSSPHGEWWEHYATDQENYCFFTTGTLSIYGTNYKVCTPGDSANSMIIKILEGYASPPGQMPAGGPFFTTDQIAQLATWIDNGCLFGNGTTTPENCSFTPDTSGTTQYLLVPAQ